MKKFFSLIILLSIQNCIAAKIFSSSNLYGLKNDENEIILKAQYNEIKQLEYVPPKAILIPMQATQENKTVKTDYFKLKQGKKYGVANNDGKIIHDIKYDDVKLNENGEIVLVKDDEEIIANPVKNSMKTAGKTMESIICLPVTIVAGVMIPIEMISKIGRKN